ncbi:MAG: M24 family metallopeptidase [Patescibacteria group bacterium]|nr:M24 family metallopeptidase [Patescibacteria group bacterium]
MVSKLTSINLGCRLLDLALNFIKPRLLPGKTELQIKRQINSFLKSSGAQGFAFPTIVAFGNHTANIHHKPTNRKLTNNQIVMIDIGVKINGWCCDITRMFFVGQPKPIWLKTYRQVLRAQQKAIFHLRGGKLDASAVDAVARKIIQFPHSLGHGLGKKIHGRPKIGPKSKDIIKPDDVITIEPGYYLKNRFGIRIEDTLLKTATGYRPLTKFPKSLQSLLHD